MTDNDKEYIESEIEFHRMGLEHAKGRIEELPTEKHALVYYRLANHARSLAVFALLRGVNEDAGQWFSRAAVYYLKRVLKGREFRQELEKSYWENEPLSFRNATYCAILSGAQDIQTDVASEALAMDDTYLTEFPTTVHDYYVVQALAAVLLNREDARQRIAHANANPDHLRPELHTYFSALVLILEGIAKDDARTTIDGIEQLLADHDGDIQGTPKGADEIVCVPATALLVLARERGLDVEIESEYIPETLLS